MRLRASKMTDRSQTISGVLPWLPSSNSSRIPSIVSWQTRRPMKPRLISKAASLPSLMRWWKDSDVVAWRLKLSPDWQAALKKEVGEYGDTLPAVEGVVEKIQEVFPGATVKTDTFVEDFVDGK